MASSSLSPPPSYVSDYPCYPPYLLFSLPPSLISSSCAKEPTEATSSRSEMLKKEKKAGREESFTAQVGWLGIHARATMIWAGLGWAGLSFSPLYGGGGDDDRLVCRRRRRLQNAAPAPETLAVHSEQLNRTKHEGSDCGTLKLNPGLCVSTV